MKAVVTGSCRQGAAEEPTGGAQLLQSGSRTVLKLKHIISTGSEVEPTWSSMTVSGDTQGILGIAGEYGLLDRKRQQEVMTGSAGITQLCHSGILMPADVRGSDATFKIPQRFLRGQKVVILVLEVIELQVTASVHPEQLVTCGPDGEGQRQSTVQSGQGCTPPQDPVGGDASSSGGLNPRLAVAR